MAFDERPASVAPKFSPEDSLAYYKTQYEQLEAELTDFQASSKELEAELEKDVEAAEKRERELRQKVESLGYEVDEWKSKYKQSKTEANTAQNALQKEITGLRETNRTVQSRLRDIEVSNDDMERQARNTSSSLEDLESKYNVAIERGVLAEEEIRAGEQEREALRIESQRLRDELNDLKIEAEIRQNKLQKAEALVEHNHHASSSHADLSLARPQSVLSEFSPTTSASSHTFATPHTKSASSTVSETPTPPSPPSSDTSNTATNIAATALPVKPKPRQSDANITPRPPSKYSSHALKHSRGPSMPVNSDRTPHLPSSRAIRAPSSAKQPQGLVQSGSLYHLHGLMSKMQSLEQRVHSVRSKLPAPTSTPPRASPRSGSALGQSFIPSTVTVRSSKRRAGGSNASSVHTPVERPGSRLSSAYMDILDRPSSRLSSGIPQPSPSRDPDVARPPSRDPHSSRPSSRTSVYSRNSINHLPNAPVSATSRPSSRQSMSGSRTPVSLYATTAQTEPRRPRSSLGGSYGGTTNGHGHSSSVNRMSNYGNHLQQTDEEEPDEVVTPTPSRRSTFDKEGVSKLPAFSSHKTKVNGMSSGRRISSGAGDMGPPERKLTRKLSEVGESY